MQRLETGGLILGLFPQATYEEETLQLEDGDVLVVFSDGVTEAFNAAGDEFGEERLLPCLDANRGSEPRNAAPACCATVQEVSGERGPERRRDRARPEVSEALVESLQRFLFGVERVEDRQQLRDGQQIGASSSSGSAASWCRRRVTRGIRAHELAEPGAVDVVDVGQVDENLLVP